MRQRAFLMLGLAAVLGIVSVFLLRGLIARHAPVAEVNGSVVVARVPLNVGESLNSLNLMSVPWPSSIVPVGAFGSVHQLLPAGVSRVALQPIERGEPILPDKISGPGGRASLSAVINAGMRAITIRVNEVLGVAGFVLPGDRVDVLLTRNGNTDPTTGILLQSVLVLGVDQDASEKTDKPLVARAVTLEVTPRQAEKLTLASQVGTLSLALRNRANLKPAAAGPIGVSDLMIRTAAHTAKTSAPDSLVSVRIFRGTVAKSYEVGVASGTVSRPGS